MADKMVFPIGFDLQAAVDEAGKDWDKKYAKRLEDLIAKRPINVKLKLDTSKLDSLDAVKKRLAELKIEPITPETKAAIKELARELNQLARAMEAVSKYTISRGMASPDAVRAARIAEIDAKRNVALERQRKLQADVRIKEERLALAREKAARAAERSAMATRNANREYQSQDGYISRLIKRLAVYAGYRQITGFLDNVRKVTAEFELQRVSLGAIIQDQQRANALFSEIKSFALKSPVSILDLTKYTKQLAAYKIGVDELFETTKKLTDVSVGLGVSMDRVVLAYGQTRATGYLRASEIRQFTEMGVPIVEELAAKLSKMNGELVTAAQVMDMVSKRAISFELVKEVFDDMTSAGGMFYNMQEKQGNTLFGLWAKLGDAASVMYDEIGNTDSVNSAMKGTIQLLTDLMKNWREVGRTMGAAAVGFAALWSVKKVKGWQSNIDAAKIAANEKYIASSNAYRAAIQAEQAARATATAEEYRAIAAKTASAEASYTAARAEYLAARNTTLWSKAWNKLKTAFLGNWLALLLAGLAAVALHFYNLNEKANRLTKALKEIKDEGAVEMEKSVYNFETLAKTAVEAADGSREQKAALEELQRTYRNIIPDQDLTIEKLREMKGEYTSLTNAIRQYIAQQTQQKQIDTIISETESKVIDAQRRLENFLSKQTIEYNYEDVTLGFSEQQIDKAVNGMKEVAKTTKDSFQIIKQAFKVYAGIELSDKQVRAIQQYNDSMFAGHIVVKDFVSALTEQQTRINAVVEDMSGATAEMGIFADRWSQTAERIRNTPLTAKENTFLYDRQRTNASIKEYIAALKDDFAAIGLAWKEEWANVVEKISSDTAQLSSINFDAITAAVREKGGDYAVTIGNAVRVIQNSYDNLIPKDAIVSSVRSKFEELANSMGLIDKVRGNMMGATEDLESYRKKINDTAKDYAQQVQNLTKVLAVTPIISLAYQEIADKLANAEKLKEFYELMAEMLGKTSSGGRGSQSDNRLSQLNEIEQTLTKINQKYDELLKKEGDTKALEHIQEIYGDTLKYINQLGEKFKLNFAMPTDFKSLQDYRKAILKVIETLKMKGYEKAALELQTKIDTGDIDQVQKDIEKQLKDLSDRISRTKTAKEFYERILSQTGDVELAGNLTMSIYGNPGEDLKEQIAMQINELMQSGEGGIEIGLDVVGEDFEVNYKNLRKLTEEAYKAKKIGDDAYKQLMSIADNGEKDVSKMVDGWMKATEKAKTYTDKLLDASRTTRAEIEKIEAQRKAGNITDAYADKQIQEYKDKLAKQQTELAYEAFKDSPMYVQMFDDLDNASTRMLENMKTRMEALKSEWKNLTPAQIKELQSRMNEIDNQLAKRNPFKTLANSIKEYRNLMKNGDARGNKSAKAADADLMATTKAADEARKKYDELIKKYGEGSEESVQEVIDAKNELDKAMANEEAAQKAVENWKKVKDAIGLSANELFQMLNWAGDIAKAVADISEALGADEEDVQYWNDVADSLNQIAGGIQNIVSAAMSGNVVGVISSVLTAIPNMFVGFFNLFNAGRIRKANKEIKRQQEILDQLEYTYGRLEKAAEKLFGGDYLRNYNRQLKNLQAQAAAYQKQADAERSKGKKADKDKIKEYENSYRDTMDEIADMQGSLSERMLGSDLASKARDFAKAWIEAYKEVGRAGAETSNKMKEKFQDMIENMVVESALAAVMQKALQPMFDMIDNMSEQDFYKESFWKKVAETAQKGAEDADKGAQTLMKFLEQAGISVKDINTEYTGIKREVASATSEEMNANTAALNAQTYYLSQVPGIAVNVALIRQFMENGNNAALLAAASTGWTDWQQQAMDHYAAIQRNTADTVVECRRAAVAAENAVSQLQRVISTKGGTHGFNVWMKT